MIERLMVTFGAFTTTYPRMSKPSISEPAVVIVKSPVCTVSFVPAGTPEFDGPGIALVGVGVGVEVGVGVGVLVSVGVGVGSGSAANELTARSSMSTFSEFAPVPR
jgi:hypothetical protein